MKSYWDQYGYFHHEGKVWTTKLIPIEPKDGMRRWEAVPAILATEEEYKEIVAKLESPRRDQG